MAMSDYVQCEVCGHKAIYDGDYRLRDLWKNEGVEFGVICRNCAKTHELIVRQKEQLAVTPSDEGQGDE